VGVELMWMAAGRLQENETNEGGRYGREPLWRECVQRAGELLAPAWPSAGTSTEEYDGLRVLALLLYAVSPAEGNWMPRQVPTEKLIEALELDDDGDGGEALIREGLAFLGHKPEDEGEWCIGTLNGMTAVRHRDYYEAVVPWDSLPSSEVPFFGSWTYFRQGAAWVQRWLKALHGPDSPDVLTRYPVLAGFEVTELHQMLARMAAGEADPAEPELRAEAQRLADVLQSRCREMFLPI
jgi:hypothetical protein